VCASVSLRDLKMDNTLLDDNDPPRIKLCDFGFAKWWTDAPCMHTITGSLAAQYRLLNNGPVACRHCFVCPWSTSCPLYLPLCQLPSCSTCSQAISGSNFVAARM